MSDAAKGKAVRVIVGKCLSAIQRGDQIGQQAALLALNSYPPHLVIQEWTCALEHEEARCRSFAAMLLSSVNHPEARKAVPRLVTLLEDSHRLVRATAGKALASMRPVQDSTIDRLKDAVRSAAGDMDLQGSFVVGIGVAGTPYAGKVLLGFLHDEGEERHLRVTAMAALVKVPSVRHQMPRVLTGLFAHRILGAAAQDLYARQDRWPPASL